MTGHTRLSHRSFCIRSLAAAYCTQTNYPSLDEELPGTGAEYCQCSCPALFRAEPGTLNESCSFTHLLRLQGPHSYLGFFPVAFIFLSTVVGHCAPALQTRDRVQCCAQVLCVCKGRGLQHSPHRAHKFALLHILFHFEAGLCIPAEAEPSCRPDLLSTELTIQSSSFPIERVTDAGTLLSQSATAMCLLSSDAFSAP